MTTTQLPPLLQTPELFELILLHLDTRTLLLSQRVSSYWSHFIRTSKPLQRKLFFLPTTTFTDLSALHLLSTTDSEKFNILDATSNRCKWLQQIVVLNDLLFDTTREWRLRSVSYADPSIQPNGGVTPSWKRMLLTQPPPSTGKGDVMFWFEDSASNDELCEGVDTMGQMMGRVYGKEGCEVDWVSAGVRPVKHAVDGGYYGRLLRTREREVEEELEVVVWEGKGEGSGDGGGGELGLKERTAAVLEGSSSSLTTVESDEA
ncbi:hypothetical protein PRZ48_012862 [Zasmidium cellare]|uniref:F-box domain-containing protein n=1 Tax=Zasmidium cellare TaxID=395010 RepID=A0ABR0E2E6_ZASCE|nr:hypothetical protein PRZ48_012862 [Zasmidium cellare]